MVARCLPVEAGSTLGGLFAFCFDWLSCIVKAFELLAGGDTLGCRFPPWRCQFSTSPPSSQTLVLLLISPLFCCALCFAARNRQAHLLGSLLLLHPFCLAVGVASVGDPLPPLGLPSPIGHWRELDLLAFVPSSSLGVPPPPCQPKLPPPTATTASSMNRLPCSASSTKPMSPVSISCSTLCPS